MIIQHINLEKHFKKIEKVCEFCLFGKKIQIYRVRSWVYLPLLRASGNKKTRYFFKICSI